MLFVGSPFTVATNLLKSFQFGFKLYTLFYLKTEAEKCPKFNLEHAKSMLRLRKGEERTLDKNHRRNLFLV